MKTRFLTPATAYFFLVAPCATCLMFVDYFIMPLGLFCFLSDASRSWLARVGLAFVATLIVLLALTGGEQSAAEEGKSQAISAQQADLGEQRGQLRQRIENLQKELAANEDHKASAETRLKDAERRITRLQQSMQRLDKAKNDLKKQLQTLNKEGESLRHTLSLQQQTLGKSLYWQYVYGNPHTIKPLKLLLNGDNPNQLARNLFYLSRLAQNRAALMGQLQKSLAQQKELAEHITHQQNSLQTIEREQQDNRLALEKERGEKQALYEQLSHTVHRQKQTISTLQEDEKRMTRLIEKLGKILAAEEQAARERERAAAKKRELAREKAKERSRELAKQREAQEKLAAVEKAKQHREADSRPDDQADARDKPDVTDDEHDAQPERRERAVADVAFVRQKGKLTLPVRGRVQGRFGKARTGGGVWRGLFIQASAGKAVHALAAGQVVYAEWMRGFGHLMIIDHGQAYLSIYGNNQRLLKNVGERVQRGEVIAEVGNSGSNPDYGLYFELRHQGQPVDPLRWASLK